MARRHSHEVFDSKGSKREMLRRTRRLLRRFGWPGGETEKPSANGSASSPQRLQPEPSAEPPLKSSANGSARPIGPSPDGPSAKTSAEAPAETPLHHANGSAASSPGSSSVRSPTGSAANGSARFPPLIVERFGKAARVRRAGKSRRILGAEDFARKFLRWLEEIDPKFRNGRVCVPD